MNATFQYTLGRSGCLALAIFCLTTSLTGCYRNDTRTEIIQIPTLGSEPCATYLESNLALVRGIEKVTADPYGKEAEVTFDARQLSLRNVEHHIARFGFDVDARPLQHETDQPYRIEANAANKSRLPPECQ